MNTCLRACGDRSSATKQKCGESTSGLSYEKFEGTLKKNKAAIQQRHKVDRVKFTVYVKEGLDLAVDPFGRGVGDVVLKVGQDIGQVALQGPRTPICLLQPSHKHQPLHLGGTHSKAGRTR